MKTFPKIFLPVLIIFAVVSCNTPLADIVEGTYNGTIVINAVPSGPATTTITKSSDNKVLMSIVIGSDAPVEINQVLVEGESNPYSLTYEDPNSSLYGNVDGNELIFTIYYDGGSQATFMGEK